MSDREIPVHSSDIAGVLEALVVGNFQQRWEIAKSIPHLGETVIAPLVRLLETEDADLELCWFIARILGEFDHPRSIEALVELLVNSQTEEVKAMAATTLTGFGQRAVLPLSRLLEEPQWRLLAVQSLSQIDCPNTIDPLSIAFKDPEPEIRAVALSALSNFREDRILPFLLQGLEDPAAEVRLRATIGIGSFSDLLDVRELVELLQRRLEDEDLEVKQQAAIALGRSQIEEAIEVLFQSLESPGCCMTMQSSIVRALSWIEKPSALKRLQQATEFVSLAICQEIVMAIGLIEQPQLKPVAANILKDLLDSANPTLQKPEIKQYIAYGMGQLQAVREIESLKQLAADSDARVRLHAIAALKKLSV